MNLAVAYRAANFYKQNFWCTWGTETGTKLISEKLPCTMCVSMLLLVAVVL